MRDRQLIHVILKWNFSFVLAAFAILAGTVMVPGQDTQTTDKKADSSLKSTARVNPSSLAMELSVPLTIYPGRAGNSLPVEFRYSSKVWRMMMTNFHTQTIPVSGHLDYTSEVYETTDVSTIFGVRSTAGWTSSLQPVTLIAPRDNYEPGGRLARFGFSLAALLESIPAQYGSGCYEETALVVVGECQSGFSVLTTYFCPIASMGPYLPIGHNYSCLGPTINDPINHGGGVPIIQPPAPPKKVWRLQARLSDGSTHEFRMNDKIHNCGDGPQECVSHPNGTYLAVDGSGMRVEKGQTQSDSTVRDVLYLPNGDRYIFPVYTGPSTPISRVVEKFIDKNGNFSTFNFDTRTWTDTLGREITDPLPSYVSAQNTSTDPQPFNLKGLNGADRTHSMTWADLGNVLENSGTTLKYTGQEGNCISTSANNVPGDYLFHNPAPTPFDDQIDLNYPIRRIKRERVCSDGIFNPKVLSRITLPNGQYYEFKYNEYGEITKITYPGGGFERFEYQVIPMMGGNTHEVYEQGNRGVHYRYVSFDGTNIAQTWTYEATDTQGYHVSTKSPDGMFSDRTLFSSGSSAYGFEDPLAGMVYDEKVFAGDDPNHLYPRSRTLTKWITKLPDDGDPNTVAERDPRVGKTLVINFEPNSGSALATLTKFEYDDSGSTDPSYFSHLNLKRKTTYNYAVIADKTTVDNEELNWTTIESWFPDNKRASIYETDYWYNPEYRAKGIIGLPVETRALNPANTSEVLSKSQVNYDGWFYSVTATPTGWENPNSDLRANATINKTLLKDPVTHTETWIQSMAQYDKFGNLRLSWDASGDWGRVTETVYEDSTAKPYKFAYPSKVIAPPPDPTNTGHGTDQPLTTETTYDFTTGLTKKTTDDYGQTVETDYDNMLRPTRSYGINGFVIPETQIIYDDYAHTIKVRKQIDEQNWDEATTYSDAAGRTVMTQTKDSQGDTMVNTHYDAMGRADCVTNPYRTGEAAYWNRTRFDEVGRAVETYAPAPVSLCQITGYTWLSLGTTSFDFSTVSGYEGTVSVSADASGRKGRSITNALGQLVRVDEPTAFGGTVDNDLGILSNPNQPTYYTYSALGKMIKVQQGKTGETIQYRYFLYDNLGRLLRVKQPEQEVNNTLNTTGNPDNDSWTTGMTYDVMGNVATATDAKGTVIHNYYDKANRIVTRNYTNEPAGITPQVDYYYDGKGVTGANFAKGKLTKVSSSVSETRYTNFNNTGRLLSSEQVTDNQTFAMKYAYNFAGNLIEETYPSGEIVRNFFEADGDLSRVAMSGHTYVSDLTYTAAGGVAALKLGNGRWETNQFNSRQQITQIGVGVANNDTSLWKVNYEYGELQSNGNVDGNKNLVNIGKQTLTLPGTSFTQTYKYDALQRLSEAKEPNGTGNNWSQTFGYDRFGNRTSFNQTIGASSTTQTPAVNAATNRFSAGYQYDKNGNITVDAQNWQYIFDGDNKQIAVKNGSGTLIGQYYYDGEGKRIKKFVQSSQETTIFVYSNGKLIAEYASQLPPAPTVSYTTADHLGSPRLITDKNGAVISRRDFMPFGEDLNSGVGNRSENLKYSTIGLDQVRKRFTGYEKDAETGLDFAEARYYNNKHGRFTAVDPLLASGQSASPQSFNRYIYVTNNPLITTDPSGQCPLIGGCQPHYGLVFTNGQGRYDNVQHDGWTLYTGGEISVRDSGDGRIYIVTQFGWYRPTPRDVVGNDCQYDSHCAGLSMMVDANTTVRGQIQSMQFMMGYANGAVNEAKRLIDVPNYNLAPFPANLFRTDSLNTTFGVKPFFSYYTPRDQHEAAGALFGAVSTDVIVFAATEGVASFGAARGLSMEGKAFEFRFLNKHVEGTSAATKILGKGGDVHVFNDLKTLSQAESKVFSQGTYVGFRDGYHRFSYRFDKPIGTRMEFGKPNVPLFGATVKVRENGLYHIMPTP